MNTPKTKPTLAMVLIFGKMATETQPDKPVLITRLTPTQKIALWQTKVRDDETPQQAAVRCANTDFLAAFSALEYMPDALLESEFMPVGAMDIGTHWVEIFHFSWKMPASILKYGKAVRMVPIDPMWIDMGVIEPRTLKVLNHLPHERMVRRGRALMTHPTLDGVSPLLM